MKQDIKRDIDQLKMNLVGIEGVLELFDSLTDRRLISDKEVEETKLKIKFAKEELLAFAVKNKKTLVSLEKEEMP